MDKKEFTKINDSLKELFFDGDYWTVHLLMALQRAETPVIDGAIDNFMIRIGMKNLVSRKFSRWWFEC